MARQISDTIITGTYDNLVFYKMEGKGYMRMKSSLTGKQFKTKACFANSRKSSGRFAKGNKIASEMYNSIPAAERQYSLFTRLKSKAIGLLKAGLAENEVKTQLGQLISELKN